MAEGDLTIHQAIAEILNEVGAIGKTGFNKEQGYNFRGIDAVLQHLHPLFAKYGVFFAPTVNSWTADETVSKSGGHGQRVRVKVTFTVYGPTGDSIDVTTVGEGLDYSDKATNKAMTGAFKYALFQLFAICDPAEDGDHEGPEGRPDDTPLDVLMTLLMDCGFTRPIQGDIIDAAVGRKVKNPAELTADEIPIAIRAIEGAIVDKDQLEEEPF